MNRIRKLRKEMNISQSMMAEKFNITQQAISAYENGIRDLDSETLKKFAEFFNVSTDYLLGLSDIRNTSSNHKSQTNEEIVDEFIQILIDEGLIEEGQELTPEERKKYLDLFRQSIKLAKKLK